MRIVRSFRRPAAVWTALVALGAGLAVGSPAAAGTGKTFTVNSTLDAHDASPGDGACNDGAGHCTLRAAIEEANATGAPDTIKVPSETYPLSLGQLYVSEPLSIVGGGSGSTIIDGQTTSRVFEIGNSATSISGVTIEDGRESSGGGINVDASAALALRHVVVKNNASTGPGGGIYANGQLTVSHSVIESNTASGYGGGIQSFSGASLSHVTILNNTSSSSGGGISNFGSMTVSWSWIKGNTCSDCPGGGMINQGVATIQQSAISANSALGGGGLSTGGPTYLTNDTIYGNLAAGFGGGIEAFAYTVLVNVTVTKNQSDSDSSGGGSGGGLSGEAHGALQIRNSIVGANLFGSTGSAPNCYEADPGLDVNSVGHNLFGAITGCPKGDFLASDKKNVTVSGLKLGTFGMHGGPTPTVPVLSGSPALKLGTSCPPIDQRGVKRPKNGCDAGAYELTPA